MLEYVFPLDRSLRESRQLQPAATVPKMASIETTGLAAKSQVYFDVAIDDEPIGRIIIMVRVLCFARRATATTTVAAVRRCNGMGNVAQLANATIPLFSRSRCRRLRPFSCAVTLRHRRARTSARCARARKALGTLDQLCIA